MKYFILKTDGASRGNPGDAGVGFVLLTEDGDNLFEYKRYIGETTNNIAEYKAISYGLKVSINFLSTRPGSFELPLNRINIKVLSDSQLVIRQLKGEYKLRADHLREYYKRIKEVSNSINSVEFQHIPREENEIADRLANEAINEKKREHPKFYNLRWPSGSEGLS